MVLILEQWRRSIGKKKTDELAVMVDTFAPLKLTQLAIDLSGWKVS